MKLRTEAVERANFVKPDPEITSFILRAFPEQAAALKREWLTNLTERIGAGRAELLDQFIRTPLWTHARRSHRGSDLLQLMQAGPRWFDRGQFDLRIDVEEVMGPNGRDALRIRYESDSPARGDLGGSRENIPVRFRHLLTPEMLDGPETVITAPSKTVVAGKGGRTTLAVTQFDSDAPGLRAAYMSGFESGYTAAFMGDPPGASRPRWAPTHDRPSFARQVGFLAGERAAFEVLLEDSAREHESTSVEPSAAGNDTPRGSRSK